MARKRKRKQSVSPGRIALFAAPVLLALAGVWAWQHRARVQSAVSRISTELPLPAQPDANAAAVATRVTGRLSIRHPPRDAQIGVSADAAILLRIVEMYQWHERCGLTGGACSYDASWSVEHVDSARFRVPAGHENPPAPFAGARFAAGEIKLGGLVVDPELLNAQPAVDHPVKDNALPPNLAATFTVADGVLYAGGDAAHPKVGTVRIRYRIVPAGEVELSGFRRGGRLEAR